MPSRILTDEQIEQAKDLRTNYGYTKRQLAEEYDVAETTIWYLIYGRKRKTNREYTRRPKPVYAYVDIQGFISIVKELREKGLNSGQVAEVFDVPVEQINLIWCKTL
jgi:orotate phosphoribosyltransferase-like protein